MIQEITKFIESKTSFVIGTNLFMGHRPQEKPDRCVLISESVGGSPVSDLPDRQDKPIQVITRNTTYLTARADAYEVYDAIYANHPHGSAAWTLPIIGIDEYEALIIKPIAAPQYIGQDEKGRYEFSTNYLFMVKKL